MPRLVVIAIAAWVLRHTAIGLAVRAAGTEPRAVDKSGLSVTRVRYGAVLFTGFMSALAGCFLSIGDIHTFTDGMTNGAGYLALAAVIFGNWKIGRTVLASLFFGAATALQFQLPGDRRQRADRAAHHAALPDGADRRRRARRPADGAAVPDPALRAMSADVAPSGTAAGSVAAAPARIRITAAGQRFTASTNPDAPRTVAAFRKLLPYRQRLIHVRWSGEACWIPLGDFRLGVDFENATSHPSAGDVLFYPGGPSEAELLIAYGACRFSSRVGQLAGNHFMTHRRRRRGAARARPHRALARRPGRALRGRRLTTPGPERMTDRSALHPARHLGADPLARRPRAHRHGRAAAAAAPADAGEHAAAGDARPRAQRADGDRHAERLLQRAAAGSTTSASTTRPDRAPIEPLRRLLPAWREAGGRVLWVNWGNRPDLANMPPNQHHLYKPQGQGIGLGEPLPGHGARVLEKDSWAAAVVDELVIEPQDIRVDKHRISGFWDTPLDSILRNLGTRTILFAGVNTDQCVLCTLDRRELPRLRLRPARGLLRDDLAGLLHRGDALERAQVLRLRRRVPSRSRRAGDAGLRRPCRLPPPSGDAALAGAMPRGLQRMQGDLAHLGLALLDVRSQQQLRRGRPCAGSRRAGSSRAPRRWHRSGRRA